MKLCAWSPNGHQSLQLSEESNLPARPKGTHFARGPAMDPNEEKFFGVHGIRDRTLRAISL